MKALLFGEIPIKSIPYPAEVHSDGTGTNHGFRALKGSSTDVAEVIEEAKQDQQLAAVLREINRANSPLVSVGCANLHIPNGTSGRGYIDIAFNTLEEAKDSVSYFRLFERFTEFSRIPTATLPIRFYFEIERSLFATHNVEAFTVQIWLMVGPASTRQQVEDTWRVGLNVLERFVATLPGSPAGTPIF
jgi:hypothetical protein